MTPPDRIKSLLDYQIVRLIYEGGMGVVYEAEQQGAHGFVKRVAIKVIRGKFAAQSEFLENFIGEAKLVADLIHTNIVQTYHLGETDGTCFICMELLNGVNLDQFVHQLAIRRKKLPTELAVFIISRVARGLAYAHAKAARDGSPLGIVHRDVSPKNIMIAFEGDVKLTDFGIAKARGYLTDKEGEEVAGKAEYMSPEQADFQITDKRSDIFSAGVVLSQLLTGQNIFRGQTPEASRKRIMETPIPDFSSITPEIEPRLNALLVRALERDLTKRYQNAEDFLYDLEYFIYHRGYGPTNETLGKFVRELFGTEPAKKKESSRGHTMKIDSSSRTQSKAGTQSNRKSNVFERLKNRLK
ncbi:MAG TPA: serine/threonine-protein kinase [Candidatus Limnocylindria bacterium]|jgi:serine/threonine-protein kinase|nr:serine/threonine-protein kinase [Candidatus Limnocylindria bacterium]